MNKQDLVSMELSFRQEEDNSWMVNSSLGNSVRTDGYVPVKCLPISSLETILRTAVPEQLPVELKVALEEILENKKRDAKRKTELVDASIANSQSLGNGCYLEGGVLVQYFPTVNLTPDLTKEK